MLRQIFAAPTFVTRGAPRGTHPFSFLLLRLPPLLVGPAGSATMWEIKQNDGGKIRKEARKIRAGKPF